MELKLKVGESTTLKSVQDKMKWSSEYMVFLMPSLRKHIVHMLVVGSDYEDFGEDIVPNKEDLDINIDLTITRIKRNLYEAVAEIKCEFKGGKGEAMVSELYDKEVIKDVFDILLDR